VVLAQFVGNAGAGQPDELGERSVRLTGAARQRPAAKGRYRALFMDA
jgi:hypothetical protein